MLEEIAILRTHTAKTWMEDGIIHTVLNDESWTVDHVYAHLGVVADLAGGQPRPVFVDVRAQTRAAPREVRDLYATEEAARDVQAIGILTGSLLTQYLGNFFIMVHRPKRTTRMFTDADAAMTWLAHHRNDAAPSVGGARLES